jgi:hypothetical protein
MKMPRTPQLFWVLILSTLALGCNRPEAVDPGVISNGPAAPATAEAQTTNDPQDSPENATRQFMLAMLAGDEAAVRRWSMPHPEIKVLLMSPAPPEVVASAREQIGQMPLSRLKVGDVVNIPGGKPMTLDESHVNENRQQLMPPDAPLPFILVRSEGQWKVDPSPLIAARKVAAALTEARKSPAWSIDEALLAQLGEEQPVDNYAIRLPPGYAPLNQPAPGPIRAFAFEMPLRDDRTAADFALILQTLTGEQAGAKSFEEHFNEVVEAVKRKRDDWSPAPPETGQIDGRPFLRLHWTGTGRPVARKALDGRKMQGFIYFSIVGQNAIIMLAQDVEPEAENTLPLLEAAALTLQKKPE